VGELIGAAHHVSDNCAKHVISPESDRETSPV
jgi:hypothetical protein